MGQQQQRTVVDLGDFTLDEMDAVEAVKAEHGVGYLTAATYVWKQRTDPGVPLDSVRKLRARDVQLVGAPDDDDTTEAVPTNGR
jgi:hypothetical protein